MFTFHPLDYRRQILFYTTYVLAFAPIAIGVATRLRRALFKIIVASRRLKNDF